MSLIEIRPTYDSLAADNKALVEDQIETQKLMIEAIHTITGLRTWNREMSIRLQMFDDMKAILQTRFNDGSNGAAINRDIVYDIKKKLKID